MGIRIIFEITIAITFCQMRAGNLLPKPRTWDPLIRTGRNILQKLPIQNHRKYSLRSTAYVTENNNSNPQKGRYINTHTVFQEFGLEQSHCYCLIKMRSQFSLIEISELSLANQQRNRFNIS